MIKATGETGLNLPIFSGIHPERRSVWPRKTELMLFALFAFYGTSFSFAGQLRHVELFIIIWAAFHLRGIIREANGLCSILARLFLVCGAAHFVSGLINVSPTSAIIARTGTYFILAALLWALNGMVKNDQRRLGYMLGGYALSYVFIMVVGTSTSRGYALAPWRLGLGFAATIALCLLFVAQPRWQRFAPMAFLLLAGVHVFMEARSLAGITLFVAGMALLASLRRRRRPSPFRPIRVIGLVALVLLGAWTAPQTLTYMAERGWLTEDMNRKMLLQANSTVGFWVAARPDTATAIQAIGYSPIIGFGPGVVDPRVYQSYAETAAQSMVSAGADYGAFMQRKLDYEWVLGTPSHSHIFGAWADAGVFAALCWALVIIISIRVLSSNLFFLHPWAPLYNFIAISTVWDVLLSRGPHRLDISLRSLVLIFSLKYFKGMAR